jgi:hypothetical protein
MPREFIPMRTSAQILVDLCEHAGVPVPTAIRVEADRDYVRGEIREAQRNGDTDRVKALEDANRDLLEEDRESVLEPKIKELRTRAEEGDSAAGREAARLQRELDEIRDNRKADDDVIEDEDVKVEDVPTEPGDESGNDTKENV